eukprot:CAMPEP_0171199646 /NCGR_PEP_ID=MMETSP0790-20130122/23570_1 /TAXON_ID=2925 /ORGANISM="Alexandrium catenella, Strain OF101" /LENGTH=175 /DNA_ID=CAMNT_0011664997 /DNA_START=66 /DNA_END=590 /DNA_ORIENTATION=+
MPQLPDGSFAVAEAWFAKRSKPKCPADEFWRSYDGFGQRHISFAWPDEKGRTPLHEAAAFGRPTEAAVLLIQNPECWAFKTSKGRTALDVALDGVKWCEENGRPLREKKRHQEVADLCRTAKAGEPIPEPDIEPDAIAEEPGPSTLRIAIESGVYPIDERGELYAIFRGEIACQA